jgi:hypothetical protein
MASMRVRRSTVRLPDSSVTRATNASVIAKCAVIESHMPTLLTEEAVHWEVYSHGPRAV